jgi:hypothetical protein
MVRAFWVSWAMMAVALAVMGCWVVFDPTPQFKFDDWPMP